MSVVLKTEGTIPIQVMEYARHLVDLLVNANHGTISEAIVVDNTDYDCFYNQKSQMYRICYVLFITYDPSEWAKFYTKSVSLDEKHEERRKYMHEFLKVDGICITRSEPSKNLFFIGLDGYKQFQQEKQLQEIKSQLSELHQLFETMWFHPDMPGGREQVKKAKRSYGFLEEEEMDQGEVNFLKTKIGQLETTVAKLESEVHELKRKVDAKDGLNMLVQKPLVFSGKNNVKDLPGFISGGGGKK